MSTLFANITTERDEYIIATSRRSVMSTLLSNITAERDEYIIVGHHGGA